MRILLVTGKGGVGKTTVAAATALQAADLGHRTIILSTDPAHSLGDAFQVSLGDDPTEVSHNLDAQQIDAQKRMEDSWGTVRDHITDLFDWSGFRGVEAEELTVLPGLDELFSLVAVRDHAASGKYDIIVVDCAPTAETLRLLSLPEMANWYMEKIFPTGRKLAKAVRPMLNKVTSIPIANDDVFEAVAGFYERIDAVRSLLADSEITSARLVMNPEKMVVAEARRTYTYLGLFGYAVDAAIVNRVLPETVTDPYFKRWREIQEEHLVSIDDAFADVEVMRLRLFDEEMVGVDRLRLVGHELYADVDPTERFRDQRPFVVRDDGDDVVLELRVPLADKGDLDIMRHGDELYITLGPYRRSFVLPDSLKRREVRRAKLEDGKLQVTFGLPDD